jgi:hypothetical protein
MAIELMYILDDLLMDMQNYLYDSSGHQWKLEHLLLRGCIMLASFTITATKCHIQDIEIAIQDVLENVDTHMEWRYKLIIHNNKIIFCDFLIYF